MKMNTNNKRNLVHLILGIADTLFAGLGLLSAMGMLTIILVTGGDGLMTAGADFAFGPQIQYVVGAGMVMGLLFFAFVFINNVILLVSGVGLILDRRWGLVCATVWGGANGLFIIGFGLFSAIMLLLDHGAPSGASVVGALLISIGVFLPAFLFAAVNLGIGLRGLMSGKKPAPHAGPEFMPSLDPSPVPATRESAAFSGAPDFPAPERTEQFSGDGEKKISVQVFIHGQPKMEVSLQVRDAMGQPIRNIIGRASDCDVQIPLNSVSAHHCCIAEDKHGNLFVDDLQSSHGTYLERSRGAKRRLSGKAVVFNGDRIFCGPYVQLILTILQPSPTKLRA